MQNVQIQEDMLNTGEIDLVEKNPFFTTLLVDAHLAFRAPLEDFLKSEGHDVLTVETAEEALAMTRQFQPDLILLDTQVGGISGLALMGELLLEQNSAAVIMLATNPTVEESVEALKRGAMDYLYRPTDLAKLKVAIDIQKALFKTP